MSMFMAFCQLHTYFRGQIESRHSSGSAGFTHVTPALKFHRLCIEWTCSVCIVDS